MSRKRKRNRERTWLTILRTIVRNKGQAAAWRYVTALRGPDLDDIPAQPVKAVFTAPLRARGEGLAVADESSYYNYAEHPTSVLRAFHHLMSREVSYHYLKHLISAWYILEPGVARVLEQVLKLKRILEVEQNGRNMEQRDLCIAYMREVVKWLERTNVLPEGGKDAKKEET